MQGFDDKLLTSSYAALNSAVFARTCDFVIAADGTRERLETFKLPDSEDARGQWRVTRVTIGPNRFIDHAGENTSLRSIKTVTPACPLEQALTILGKHEFTKKHMGDAPCEQNVEIGMHHFTRLAQIHGMAFDIYGAASPTAGGVPVRDGIYDDASLARLASAPASVVAGAGLTQNFMNPAAIKPVSLTLDDMLRYMTIGNDIHTMRFIADSVLVLFEMCRFHKLMRDELAVIPSSDNRELHNAIFGKLRITNLPYRSFHSMINTLATHTGRFKQVLSETPEMKALVEKANNPGRIARMTGSVKRATQKHAAIHLEQSLGSVFYSGSFSNELEQTTRDYLKMAYAMFRHLNRRVLEQTGDELYPDAHITHAFLEVRAIAALNRTGTAMADLHTDGKMGKAGFNVDAERAKARAKEFEAFAPRAGLDAAQITALLAQAANGVTFQMPENFMAIRNTMALIETAVQGNDMAQLAQMVRSVSKGELRGLEADGQYMLPLQQPVTPTSNKPAQSRQTTAAPQKTGYGLMKRFNRLGPSLKFF